MGGLLGQTDKTTTAMATKINTTIYIKHILNAQKFRNCQKIEIKPVLRNHYHDNF